MKDRLQAGTHPLGRCEFGGKSQRRRCRFPWQWGWPMRGKACVCFRCMGEKEVETPTLNVPGHRLRVIALGVHGDKYRLDLLLEVGAAICRGSGRGTVAVRRGTQAPNWTAVVCGAEAVVVGVLGQGCSMRLCAALTGAEQVCVCVSVCLGRKGGGGDWGGVHSGRTEGCDRLAHFLQLFGANVGAVGEPKIPATAAANTNHQRRQPHARVNIPHTSAALPFAGGKVKHLPVC